LLRFENRSSKRGFFSISQKGLVPRVNGYKENISLQASH
jgi:hypothetical protein